MIPTLLSTNTADSDSGLAITSNIDGDYDEYMLVMTDIHPETDNNAFTFQASTNGGSSYGVAVTTTLFAAHMDETGSYYGVAYAVSDDEAQSTGYQYIGAGGLGGAADESLSGIIHLFSPANTTYVKHFLIRSQEYYVSNYTKDTYVQGYFNSTSAINALNFGMAFGGDFSGVIQLYGIS